MTSKRPYRLQHSAQEVIQELVDNSGTQFDPALVGIFLDVIEENSLLDVPEEVLIKARKKLETGN